MSAPNNRGIVVAVLGAAVLAALIGNYPWGGEDRAADPQAATQSGAAPSTQSKETPQLRSAGQAQRTLPAPTHDRWEPRAPAPAARAPATVKSASVTAGPERAPPMPFTYVGKGRDERGRFAVLGREDRIYVMRVGDVLERRYRLEVIGEDRLLMTYLPLGTREILGFSGSSERNASKPDSAPVLPADAAAVTLSVTGPRQAAIGEEFTLMIGLEPGNVGLIQEGNVELSYDTKVLRRSIDLPQTVDSGRARIDIAGGHTGHTAPTAVQFRVVAAAPTTTEIRIVPTDVANSEGRNVAVAGPEGYRLTVVAAPTK